MPPGSEFGKRDANFIVVMMGVTDDENQYIRMLRVDPTTNRLKVVQAALDKSTDSVIAELEGHENVGHGDGEVATAGSPAALPNVPCKRVWIQCSEWNGEEANCPNGGIIVVGGSGVIATLASRTGKALFPTQGDWFNVSNLNLLYINALDDGAKFHYYWEN